MALIHIDGFDHYGDDETKLTEGVYESIDSSFAISLTNPRTGSRCIRRDTTVSRHYIVKDLGTQNQTIGMGFSFFIDQLPDAENSYVLCDMRDQNGDVQIEVLIQDDGSIEVRLTSGVIIGSSSPGIVSANSFNHFEIGVYFDSGSTGGSVLVESFDGDFDATDPDDITTSKEVPPTNNISVSTSPENTITVTLPEGRTFEAWNAWGTVSLPDFGWLNGFYYKADGGLAAASDLTRYATPTEAREAFDSFSLTGFSEYIIYLFDFPITDNLGGLSIHVDVFAPTTIDAQGILECRLNGVTIISESGMRTTSTENNECSKVSLAGGWSIVHGVTTDFDDWYVWNDDGAWNNSFIGDRRCFLLKPNQDTNIADFDPSSGDFGYKMIDDSSPDDDSSYIIAEAYLQSGSPLTGTSEFEIEDLSNGTSLISAVNVITRASKTDETSAELYTSINSGADSLSQSPHILTTSYQYYDDIYEYDPETISSLTRDSFNSLSVSITADDLDPGAIATSPTDSDEPFSPSQLFSLGEDGAWYDPSDLSTLWQDTSGTIPVTTSGQSVARIDDKSGNGRNLIQSTSANRPTYQTSGGLHWLDFDGTNDFLQLNSNSANITEGGGSMAVSAASDEAESARGMFEEVDVIAESPNSSFRNIVYFDTDIATTVIANYAPDDTDRFILLNAEIDGTEKVFIFVSDGTNGNAYLDNVLQGSSISTTSNFSNNTRITLGKQSAGPLFHNGKIYGALMLDRALSSTERDNLNTYLGTKAGL